LPPCDHAFVPGVAAIHEGVERAAIRDYGAHR
jgi:hypothetical protein